MKRSDKWRDEFKGKEILKVYLLPETMKRIKAMSVHNGIEPWEVVLRLMNDGQKWRQFKGGKGVD